MRRLGRCGGVAGLSGGGVIIESAIHILDQLLLITGAESVQVTSVEGLRKNGIDYDTVFETWLSFQGSKTVVTSAVSSLRNLQNGVYFKFEHALVYCGMSANEQIKIYDNSGQPMQITVDLADSVEEGMNASSPDAAFYYFWKDFIDAIEKKINNKTSAVNSLLTTEWIEKIYTTTNHLG